MCSVGKSSALQASLSSKNPDRQVHQQVLPRQREEYEHRTTTFKNIPGNSAEASVEDIHLRLKSTNPLRSPCGLRVPLGSAVEILSVLWCRSWRLCIVGPQNRNYPCAFCHTSRLAVPMLLLSMLWISTCLHVRLELVYGHFYLDSFFCPCSHSLIVNFSLYTMNNLNSILSLVP